MINRIVLVGRLVAEAEERTSNDGMAIAKFRLAVDRRRRGRDGEREADFFNVVCFRHSAEFVLKYLGKGDLVGVEGSLQIDRYERDGKWESWVEVVADNVQSLGRSEGGGGGGGGGRGRGGRGEGGRGEGGGGGGRGGWDHDADFPDEPLDQPEGGRRGGRGEEDRGRPAGGGDSGGSGGGGGRGRGREPEREPGESRRQSFDPPAGGGGGFDEDDDDPFAEE